MSSLQIDLVVAAAAALTKEITPLRRRPANAAPVPAFSAPAPILVGPGPAMVRTCSQYGGPARTTRQEW